MRGLLSIPLASGSSGNSVYIKSGKVELLIDAGISKKRIECALNSIGSTLSNITAIFITHEHSDHISSLDMISKQPQNTDIPDLAERGGDTRSAAVHSRRRVRAPAVDTISILASAD